MSGSGDGQAGFNPLRTIAFAAALIISGPSIIGWGLGIMLFLMWVSVIADVVRFVATHWELLIGFPLIVGGLVYSLVRRPGTTLAGMAAFGLAFVAIIHGWI